MDERLAEVVRGLPFVQEAKVVDGKLLATLDDPETHNPEIKLPMFELAS